MLHSVLYASVISYKGYSKNASLDVLEYLRPLLHYITTPLGLVAFIAGFAVLAYGWQGKLGKEVLLFIAVLTGMVGYFISKYWSNALIGPLGDFRSVCKPLFVLSVVMLALRYLVSRDTLRVAPPRSAAIAYLVLLVLYSVRAATESPTRAVASIFLVSMVFLGVIQLFRRATLNGKDFNRMLTSVVLGGIAFFFLSIVQLVLGAHDTVVAGGRFYGLSDNPQNIGENTAFLIIAANYLILSGYSSRWQRIVGIIALAGMFPFLLWTGSRTSAGMVAVGLFVMNGVAIRRWVIFGSLAGVAWEAYSHLYRHASAAASRLGSTLNDRTATWLNNWHRFLQHPILGQVNVKSLVENSYLSVAVGTGIIGLAVLILLIEFQGRDVLEIARLRTRLGKKERTICDFAIALSAALAAGMFFDAYLLAVATTQGLFVAIALATTAIAIDLVGAANRCTVPQTAGGFGA